MHMHLCICPHTCTMCSGTFEPRPEHTRTHAFASLARPSSTVAPRSLCSFVLPPPPPLSFLGLQLKAVTAHTHMHTQARCLGCSSTRRGRRKPLSENWRGGEKGFGVRGGKRTPARRKGGGIGEENKCAHTHVCTNAHGAIRSHFIPT